MSSLLIYSRLLILLTDGEGSNAPSLVPLQLFCALSFLVVQLLFPRHPQTFSTDGRPVDAEGSSSLLVRFSMVWCHSALDIAGKSDDLKTIPELGYEARASSQSVITVPSPQPYVWNRILIERLPLFVKQYTVVFMRAGFALGSPYCLKGLLKSLERSEHVTIEAWMWFAGIGASATVETIALNYTAWTQMSEICIPVKAQLFTSIFQKLLRRKGLKEQKNISKLVSETPDVINVLSADASSLSFYAAIAYLVPLRLFKFVLAVWFLYRLLGWKSTFTAVVATLACFSGHHSTVKQTNVARQKVRSSRDRTTSALKEALSSLHEIKFSSLELQWETHIDSLREQELRELSYSRTAATIRGIWYTAAPFIVIVSVLCTYLYSGGYLTPSVVFPMITVLHQLQETLSFIPTALKDYFYSSDTSGRIDKYLSSSEIELKIEPSPLGTVVFEDATITWPMDDFHKMRDSQKTETGPGRFLLQGLNLEFPFGELSIVSGKIGSGKSLLLSAILGEAELLQGHIKAPSAAGCSDCVAYVSQVPWLQSGTIQENILFGSPLDPDRYNTVVSSCALLPDFHALPDGDQAKVGLRGVKLSGGQRTRVSFARALYSSAKLLVLDDIFSTLDTNVSKEILCTLTGELCKDRTRILVTHHVSLCLPYAKYVVHLENNTASYAGAPESVPQNIQHLETKEPLVSGSPSRSSFSNDKDVTKTIETRNTVQKKTPSKTPWHIYRSYFKTAGGLKSAIAFAFWIVASRLLNALSSYLLGHIKSHGKPLAASSELHTLQEDSTLLRSIATYAGTVALVIITTSFSKLQTDATALRAARVLFRQMIFTSLRMPLTWLDTTSIGAVLKDFTIDVRVVDETALTSLALFIDSAINVLVAIFIG